MKNTRPHAFTLIELLVVITIVGILMSLATPSVISALNSAKRASAFTMMTKINTGLEQYRNDYNSWPPAVTNFTDANGDIVIGFDAGKDKWGELYRSISGYTNSSSGYIVSGTTNNKRLSVQTEIESKYLSASTAEPYLADAAPADVMNIIDPWLHPYRMVLDGNYDRRLSVPDINSTAVTNVTISKSIAIWSLGYTTNNPKKYIADWK